jgi:hypothetical protein
VKIIILLLCFGTGVPSSGILPDERNTICHPKLDMRAWLVVLLISLRFLPIISMHIIFFVNDDMEFREIDKTKTEGKESN